MRRGRLAAALLGILLMAGAGCRRAPAPARPGQTFSVYQGKKKVLIARNAPGPLVSTAMLPPGQPLPQHRFLTASALYAPAEGKMRDALVAAKDFDDFLRRVQADGFTVEADD